MKKGLIIGIVIGLIVGLFFGFIVGKSINSDSKDNKQIENEKSILSESDKQFIGKWEYGTKYENMEIELNKSLSDYKEKYELSPTENKGCLYGENGIVAQAMKTNKSLFINEDGTVEYINYYGIINDKCEVQIYSTIHYKGTIENSKIIFKESESNGEWKEFRQTHNISLEDKETLRYNINNEKYDLFIKRNQ